MPPTTSIPLAPPLPPRKPVPTPQIQNIPVDPFFSPVSTASDAVPSHTGNATTQPDQQSPTRPGPPLPPRPPSTIRQAPAPILSAIQTDVNQVQTSASPRSAASPSSAFTVQVTPATPPQIISSTDNNVQHASPASPLNPQTETHPESDNTAPAAHAVPLPKITPSTVSPSSPVKRNRVTTPVISRHQPHHKPPLPPRPALGNTTGPTTKTSLQAPPFFASSPISPEWLVITFALTLLAYLRISLTWLLITGVSASFWLWSRNSALEEMAQARKDDLLAAAAGGGDAVDWVNHAMHALFPLISTDVLTPFIDLMEDALAQQVPPVVTSVRLTSAALGSQPMLLTSMRYMTDQEWFALLSKKSKLPQHQRNPDTPSKSHSHPHLSSPSTWGKGHSKGGSSASKRPGLARSASGSSNGSGLDTEEVMQRAESLRKRDRILRRLTRQRAGGGESGSKYGEHHTSHDAAGDRHVSKGRDGRDPEAEAQMEDGDRHIGGTGSEPLDEDDPSAGSYVNYQVGFEYKQPKEALKKRGWGLHVLAYFGIGVKGVGRSEFPVYIDMLHIKGTLNVRLLLSATPPFVRNLTFSLSSLPVIELSAKPLVASAFNAMGLPGMNSYVQASIAEVAAAFVSPESYSLDVDRLLLGRESSLRTASVGVLYIIVHGAADLPKSDTVGSIDPYVSISFSKFHKPLYSTRTIKDDQNPSWEEPAFILVTADSIEAGERLRLRVCDSDRFSADDAVGVVEVDISDLVEQEQEQAKSQGQHHHEDQLRYRSDQLKADRPGMRTSGALNWSVGFYPLWQMGPEELHNRIDAMKTKRRGEPMDSEVAPPWWMEYVTRYFDGKPGWEEDRAERRKETLAWFTGEKQKDELEAAAKPSEDLRSGVVQFHIHQCIDLEEESLEGTYSSARHGGAHKSAASGKPALADIVDRTPAENPEPPSAYCEVHLNDRLVYRTRTKQLTPLPYFNAVSERFIRDWRVAKITFVVRDERDREHDPILGLVTISLKDAFADRSQFSRWFPLVGGLGWGRIRISLLWKPIDIHLPPKVSGYETATLQIKSLVSTDLSRFNESDRAISMVLETESDKFTLEPGPPNTAATNGIGGMNDRHQSVVTFDSATSPMKKRFSTLSRKISASHSFTTPSRKVATSTTSPSVRNLNQNHHDDFGPSHPSGRVSNPGSPQAAGTSRSVSSPYVGHGHNNHHDFDADTIYDHEDSEIHYDLPHSIKLAVEYRHSCSVLISFVTKSKHLKKRRVIGLATVRLNDCPDKEEVERTVPIWGTEDIGAAVKAATRYHRIQAGMNSAPVSDTSANAVPHSAPVNSARFDSTPSVHFSHSRSQSHPHSETQSQPQVIPPSPSRSTSSPRRRSVSSQHSFGSHHSKSQAGPVPLIGFVSMNLVVHPGVSTAHRRLCKRDLRFKRVYEAWEVSREVEQGLDRESVGDAMRRTKQVVESGMKGVAGRGEGEDGHDHAYDHEHGYGNGNGGLSGSDSEQGYGHGHGREHDAIHGSTSGMKEGDPEAAPGRGPGVGSEEEEEELSESEEERGFLSERRAHSHALHKRNKGIFQLKIARTGKFVADKIAAKVYARRHANNNMDRRPRGSDMHVEHEGTSRL